MNFATFSYKGNKFFVNLDHVAEIRANMPTGSVLYFALLKADDEQVWVVVDETLNEIASRYFQ